MKGSTSRIPIFGLIAFISKVELTIWRSALRMQSLGPVKLMGHSLPQGKVKLKIPIILSWTIYCYHFLAISFNRYLVSKT